MEVKLFEVRDRTTFIPVMAVRFVNDSELERYLLSRSGFGRMEDGQKWYVWYVYVYQLVTNIGNWDINKWGPNNRTMYESHKYIAENFAELQSGVVIDVEFILGEVTEPVKSERETSNIPIKIATQGG